MGCSGLGKSRKQQLLFRGLLTACLVSCGEEDRIGKVACDPASGDNISIDFIASHAESAHVALPNIYHFSPGMILQLIPGASPEQLGNESVVYARKPPADSYLPVKPQSLSGRVISGHFKIEVDADVEEAAVDLEGTISKSTYVYYNEAKRKMLRNSLAVINADNGAVKTLQAGPPTSRFAVVSGVWSGGHVYVFLNDSAPFIAANTLKRGRFYLHLKYACFLPTVTSSEADSAQAEPELLFSYLPVRYDRTTKIVSLDMKPIDLTKFAFASASRP